MKLKVELAEREYLDKKLDVSKEIIAVLMQQQSYEYMRDVRKRASVIYNSVAIAEDVLEEVGFKLRGAKPLRSDDGESTEIRKLSDILLSEEKNETKD